MSSIAVYFLFQLLHLYVFFYQRTTLKIARVLDIANKNEAQMVLTPSWMGALGWTSTIGFYGSVIYLWVQWGFWIALAGLLFSHLFFAVVPIPSNYFYKIVIDHLQSEIKKAKNNDAKTALTGLLLKVNLIRERYRVD